jgi:hypothetical protein
MKERARDIAFVVLVAMASIVLWRRLWGAGQILYLWDASTYFYPMKVLLARAVASGELPWWNPWIRNGLPFFANPQVGLFYPPSLLFYALPTALAFNWNVILHTVVLATGFYGWLRGTGRSPAASTTGALAIAWGGYALSMTIYLNNLQAMAWVGWTWWAWERWLAGRTRRWLAVTSCGFALQFLAGEPQIAVVTAGIALLLAWGGQAGDGEPGGRPRARAAPLVALSAAAAGAMIVTAVQLLPTIELFLRSQRSLGLAPEESLGWSLPPAQLFNLVLPRYFESPGGLFDMRRIAGVEQPWVFTSYLGVVVVALAAAGVGGARKRSALLWVGIAATGALLALGAHNPLVAALVDAIPPFRAFRYPEKMLLLPAIAVPVLAASGIDALRVERARRRALGTACGLAALGALAWVATAAGGVDRLLADGRDAAVVSGIVDAWTHGFRHVLVFAILAATLFAAARRVSARVLAACLAILALADLATVNVDVAPVAPADLLAEEPAVLEGLPLDTLRTVARIRTSPLGEPAGLAFTMRGIATGTHQYYQIQGMGGNLAMAHRVLAQDGAEPFPPRTDDAEDAILRQLPPDHQVRYLRLQSTRWILERPMKAEGLAPDGAVEELGLFRYRLADPLPRAYLVDRVEVEPDSIEVTNRLIAGGEDPHRVAFVSEGHPLPGPGTPNVGRVRWLEGSNHSVRLDVDAPVRSLLVLTDSWYPGWTASVDGRSVPVARVNWRFRGVYLEPGTHRVRFDYRPRGIVPAAAVSAIGLLALVGLVIRGGRRGA